MHRFLSLGRSWIWTLLLIAAFATVALRAPAQETEPDNDFPEAADTVTVNGATLSLAHEAPNYSDWFQFVASAGVTYTITTGNLGASVETFLDYYNGFPETAPLVASASGTGIGGAQVFYAATAPGTHYFNGNYSAGPVRTGMKGLPTRAS